MQAQLSRAAVPAIAAGFRNNVRSLGNMSVETMRVTSASEMYTKALQKQDVTLRQALRNRQTFNQVLREQYALSRAAAVQWTTNSRGGSTLDLIVPRDAPSRLGNFRQTLAQVRAGTVAANVALGEMAIKMGLVSQVANSASANMIKWGKNTQWAGRQLMVGLTMPVLAAGAAMGKLAYDVEKQMTRINKVYDFSATKDENAAKNMQETASLRANSMRAARTAAEQFGASMKDTLSVEANLAATGEKGNELIGKTTEVMRLATLGEMDYQKALDTTITLQSVYGQNTSELAESFNYMNAVENATSLSIEDFSKAIPKVAAPMKTLEGDLQDVGTLLVAMRARGINAVEGANAIKASFTRVLKPTKQAKDMFELLTKQSLTELTDKTNGEVIPTFVALNKATENLKGKNRQALFAALFGTQQTTRLQAIVEEMGNLEDETTQVGKAYKIASQEQQEWADSAGREMEALQKSASGRLKIAVETLKVQLAEAGKPFLEVAGYIVGAITQIVKAFNDLPGPVKTFASIAIITGAIAGPIIMLAGLFGNLLGQALKLGAGMLGLVFRFRALMPEQVAARLASMQAGMAAQTQAGQVAALTAVINELTIALTRATGAQVGLNNAQARGGLGARPGVVAGAPIPTATPTPAAPGVQGPIVATGAGYRDATGRTLSAAEVRNWQAAQASAASINQNSARTRRNWQQMGSSFQNVAIAAGFMGVMASDADSMMYTVSQIAIGAALIGPMLLGPIMKFGGALKAAAMPAIAAVGSAASSMFGGVASRGVTAFRSIGASMAGPIAAMGGMSAIMGTMLAAALAIGAAWYIINKNIAASRKEQENIAKSSEAWAKTLGFTYTEQQKIVATNSENLKSMNDRMNEFKKNSKDAYNDMQKYYDSSKAEKWARAIEEGTKVRLHGGTVSAAQEATRVALAIMGEKFSNAEFESQLKVKIDFEDVEDVVKKRLQDAATDFSDAANLKFDQSGSESFARFFANPSTIQQKAGEQVRQNAKDLWDIYDNTQDAEKKKVFDKINETVNSESLSLFKKYKEKYSKDFKKMGIETFADWTEYLQKNAKDGIADYEMGKLGMSEAEIHRTQRALDAMRGFNKEFADMQGIPKGKATDQFGDLAKYMPELQKMEKQLWSVKQAEDGYYSSLRERSLAGAKTSDAEKLNIMNMYRRMAGLEDATRLEDGFKKSLDKSTVSLEENMNAWEANADNVDQFVSAYKDVFSNTQDEMLGQAEELMNQQMENEIDGINRNAEARSKALDDAQERADDRFDARQERTEKRFEAKQEALDKKYEKKQKTFDNRWESIMENHDKKWDKRTDQTNKYYDARIKKIQDAIKAEEEAEATRQKIFEAEKTRIQRAAEMANMGIDFNVAINSGNLDEAAKIGNNMQANLDSWATEDAAAASQSASDKKVEGLNKQVTSLEAERDRRLKVIEQMEEAEKKQLEKRKEREQEALNAQREAANKSLQIARERANKQIQIEREAYNKMIQAQREALQKETQDKIKATQRKYEAAKRAIELELATLKAFVPRNKKELDEHIKKVEAAYKKYGVNLKDKGDDWSKYIKDSLNKNIKTAASNLKNTIAWDKIGKSVANEITEGAFGLTIGQFSTWVSKGTLPKSGLNEKSGKNKSLDSHHEGGLIGGKAGGSGRTGYSGGRAHSEVDIRAKRGEFMMKDKAVRKYGTDFMENLNNGNLEPGIGGAGEGMGLAGVLGAGMAGMMQAIIQEGIQTGAEQALMLGMDGTAIAGAAGTYGGVGLSATQMQNAATIIGTGKGLGASQRDLIIAIMTAMQESTLRNLNYGDRDSLGLFQQRAAWGSAKARTTPSEATRMFFHGGAQGQRGLFDFPNRDKMSLGQAAQAVQVSAFPHAYAKWEDMARAVVAATTFQALAGNSGFRRPINAPVSRPYSQHTNLPRATDFATPTGTPVVSAMGGTVTTSSDLHGNGNGGYRSYGRYIVVGNGMDRTLYAHLSRRSASVGQQVRPGQLIGYSGNTGNSTGPHLHFETWRNGQTIPPGAFGIPGLLTGGKVKYDNTIANLHKNEAVLTAPLTAKLENGIDRIDSGGGNTYNFNINAEAINTEIDFEKVITKALNKIESNRGRSRVVK
ncbi:tape measure protein [Streptomyces phage StarPlatinum]|uniref:Tape measure protein n=1 Tax=Streptomyces phage StarPlatinum TaxID=2283265 RepID=A0A345M8I8_9CAUD|nr:tail length tape measure protein [Streptomyces phage StarPlatinum]AXH66809.1 tape measure protein [Streptomyces phage StarPlatinum]